MPVNVRFQAALGAALATALTAGACSPELARRGARGVLSAYASESGSQASSAPRSGFDDRRFHELLLAGRFTEADAMLSGADGEPAGQRNLTRSVPRGSPADAWIAGARAWLRIARRDWRQQDSRRSARTFSTVDNQPPLLLDVGLAAAHDAWPGADPGLLAVARQAADALEARGTTEARLFHAVVLAAIAAAQEERDLLAIALAQAQDLEWGLREAGRPLPPSFQVARVAGDMWMQVHRYGDARNAYVSATDREPRDARAWLGLARAEARLGNVPESTEAYRTFVQRWKTDDPDSQELAEARAALDEERR